MTSFALANACVAVLALALAVPAPTLASGELLVAAAANLAPAMDTLVERFEALGHNRVVVSYGSSGALYAHIKNGAPFDLLLSADVERPRRLANEGDAVAGSRFTYALGRLVLWSADRERVAGGAAALAAGRYRYLAIANPETAPYGAAARQVLEGMGLWERLQSRLVRGESVGQAYQFVASGNAELGFVSLSQVIAGGSGGHWLVPQELYRPIEQQAVLLARARDKPTARAFLAFLGSPQGRALIEQSGYGTP